MICRVRFVVLCLLSALVFPTLRVHAGEPLQQLLFAASVNPTFSAEQMKKIGSGQLLQHLARHQTQAQARGIQAAADERMSVFIYASHAPTPDEIAALEAKGVRCMPESWIPPMENHPLGFFIAQVPITAVGDVLSLPAVLKMDSAEGEAKPMNNLAAASVKATLAWTSGWTGTGVKVAVLDSGVDTLYAGSELPAQFERRDYSAYPALDNTVANTVTGHGTHVTGSVLGRGVNSASNTGNGGGAYKGMAPGADLAFLKIGSDANGGATEAAMVAAMHAAVDTYHARVLNVSYGGWDAYHDGSTAISQAMDYAYTQGAACFAAAGNEAADGRHYTGTVAANSTSGFIQVNVTNAGSNNTMLWFNLIWNDGGSAGDLSTSYYYSTQLPMSGTIISTTTQSARGTFSQYSHYGSSLPSGSGTYYLRVTNTSSQPHAFHLYDDWGAHVTFAVPDPAYTVGSPADADHAMAVAAYTMRSSWTAVGGTWTYHYTLDDITPFSDRGPRIDGVQKPNIAAPGSEVISIRDRNAYPTRDNTYWIDNDGSPGGSADYYAMQGTSMASPVAAGCAALLFQRMPTATPQQIYDAMMQSAATDAFTGAVPNSTWGYGKLDVNAALQHPALPVELASFTAAPRSGSVMLSWRTASEVNNYGFEVERRSLSSLASDPSIKAQTAWTKLGFVSGHGTDNQPHEYAFTDRTVPSGAFAYRLKQIDRDGTYEYSSVIETSAGAAPLSYELAQNYPNPFNPSTAIPFSLAKAGMVRLAIYDVLGRKVAEPISKAMESGSYMAEWNAAGFPSGVYICRLESGAFTSVRKLLLQK